ncbi:MAG TPA: dienelactone hydrolase family protein, partial [Nitrolancea sp.]|nr:dienelactone hydrolase family protein [Nitrolancea sp.]
ATSIPVQLHVAEPDVYETEDWLNAWYLRMLRAGADVEIHRYRGAGHLYTDPDLPDYDAEAAERTWATAQDFLAGL